jgi:hypothetical protein
MSAGSFPVACHDVLADGWASTVATLRYSLVDSHYTPPGQEHELARAVVVAGHRQRTRVNRCRPSRETVRASVGNTNARAGSQWAAHDV